MTDSENLFMASFDIRDTYTNVPAKETHNIHVFILNKLMCL